MSKLCTNCKYKGIAAHKTPCLNCVEYEKWEPQGLDPTDRFCETCNYMPLYCSEEPCRTCLTSYEECSLWEPDLVEDIATANPIAAAPELLVALKNVRWVLANNYLTMLGLVDDLITKVEGSDVK